MVRLVFSILLKLVESGVGGWLDVAGGCWLTTRLLRRLVLRLRVSELVLLVEAIVLLLVVLRHALALTLKVEVGSVGWLLELELLQLLAIGVLRHRHDRAVVLLLVHHLHGAAVIAWTSRSLLVVDDWQLVVVGNLDEAAVVELESLVHFLLLGLLLLDLGLLVAHGLHELLVEVGWLGGHGICPVEHLVDLAVLRNEVLLLCVLVVEWREVVGVGGPEGGCLVCELLLVRIDGVLLELAEVGGAGVGAPRHWLLVLIGDLLLELPVLKLVAVLFSGGVLELPHVHLLELVGHELLAWLLAVLARR